MRAAIIGLMLALALPAGALMLPAGARAQDAAPDAQTPGTQVPDSQVPDSQAPGSQAPASQVSGDTGTPVDAAAPPGNPAMVGPQLLISTAMGDITVQLDAVHAPKSVANVLSYVHDGHYNGTVVYRVVKGFVIQMGSWDADANGRPVHGGKVPFEANNGLSNLRGTLALAHGDDLNASADFFINLADNTALDHAADDSGNTTGFAVFGKVVDGMDVVDAIAQVPVGGKGPFPDQAPVTPILIKKISVVGEPEPAPKPDAARHKRKTENPVKPPGTTTRGP